MKRTLLFLTLLSLVAVALAIPAQRMQERLDRGLVAARVYGTNNAFISWRLFASDPVDVKFNIYRNSETTPVNPTPLDAAHTSYTVDGGAVAGTTYSVAVLYDDVEVHRSKSVGAWQGAVTNGSYLEIPVQKPTTGRIYNGTSLVPYPGTMEGEGYSIYDGTVADLDGDGEYEIIFFWAPDNLKDNSNDGYTGTVFIDAYKFDGTKLWGAGKYIDLGPNIRAGAHYNNFIVYDLDGDGKAEIVVKTGPGTMDTEGTVLGGANSNRIYIVTSPQGHVNGGPEYVSVFEGATGKLLDTKDYDPPLTDNSFTQTPTASQVTSLWGGSSNNLQQGLNRAYRMGSCVAYLDGKKPSAVMQRGYYHRTALVAWDWDGVQLTKRWVFDTRTYTPNGSSYISQGNHNLSVADVDGDGCDEIILGALVINNDGRVLYSTGRGHGDALHVGKFDPNSSGLQIMMCHEVSPFGISMRDAGTGTVIWQQNVDPCPQGQSSGCGDTGRGMTASVDSAYPGAQGWGANSTGTWHADGTRLRNGSAGSMNMAIWWDGDVGRELFDGGSNPSVTKLSASGAAPNRNYSSSTLITFSGASTNGGTKSNPCLQADVLGDWREEMILRVNNNNALRIYTSTMPTVHTGAGAVPASGVPTLMHNKEYRLSIVWQNVGYNQPPHTDFYLGYGMVGEVPRDSATVGAAFTATFDPSGGTFADGTTEVKVVKSVTGLPLENFEVSKTNKTFVGWYLSTGELFTPTVTLYYEDMDIKARWNISEVYFNANGGILNVYPYREIQPNQPLGTLPTPTRPGASFLGWNTAADGSGEVFTAATVLDGLTDVTLYAQWEIVSYTLTFNVAGGDAVTPPSISVVYGLPVGELPTPVRSGYEFMGWTTQSDCRGATITDSTISTFTANATLYACWEEIVMFTITFNPNGGELSPDSLTKQVRYGHEVGHLPVPTRSSYTFVGWNSNAQGTGTAYTSTTVYSRSTGITLYACWETGGTATGVEPEAWPALTVYPNPVTGEQLTISGLEGGETITIVDVQGRVLMVQVCSESVCTFGVDVLPQGTYFVQVAKDGVAKTVKVVVR